MNGNVSHEHKHCMKTNTIHLKNMNNGNGKFKEKKRKQFLNKFHQFFRPSQQVILVQLEISLILKKVFFFNFPEKFFWGYSSEFYIQSI